MIAGCDLFKPPEPPKKPPWGKWLPPDATHPEKRLQVKFGNVLYQIPVSYLRGQGSSNRVEDPVTNIGVLLAASYPDLVPQHQMRTQNIPQYPRIEVILGGHKDDKRTMAIINNFNQVKQYKEGPFPSSYANEFKRCGEPAPSSVASGMNQYSCGARKGHWYFVAIDNDIKTPAGYQLFINCYESILYQYKFECFIQSRLFNDRHVITRFHTSDLTNLLDMYQKTLQLLSSLEAPNQQGE